MEIWKDVPGYEGLYQISSMGRIKSFHNYKGRKPGVVLKPQNVGQGYLQIVLRKNSKGKSHYIHTLVLQAFVGKQSTKLECNHINGDKHDNRLINLEYCTRSENNFHAFRVLGHTRSMRSNGIPIAAILTPDKITKIRELYATGNYTQVTLAKMFGTSQTNVSGIIHRLTWKNI